MTVIVGALASVSWSPGSSGAATLAVRLPDGTTLAPAPTVAAAASPYTASFTTTQPGRHLLSWSRGTDRDVDIFDVWPADPRYLISLADARATVGNMPNADVASLPIYVAAATYMIELLAGPVLLTSKTHRADGARYAYNLPALPVTVTQVKVSGVVQDPSAYVVDEEAGIVYGWFATAALPLNVEISYTAGGTVIAANLAIATRELVKHLWTSGRQSGRPGQIDAAADTVQTRFGF
ncbi:MAG TPA: hypothetical protein VIK12_06370, partial [Pengzhenrongella sp.]